MKRAVLIQQVYPGLGFEPMLELTRAHHQAYCEKHDIVYRYVIDDPLPDYDPLLGSWVKIELIRQAMQQDYEYIIWLDADTLIVDTQTNLCKAVEMFKIGACWHRIPQLNHWNVGALYIHNIQDTQTFINKWLESYPPPKDGWNEQGVFNRLALQSRTVVTLSDRWNATLDVSMVPDAVVLGFHGQNDRYKKMQAAFERLFPAPVPVQVSEVLNG